MKQTFWWGFHNFGILKQDQYQAGHFHVCKLCFQTYFWILALDFSCYSTLLFYNYWRVCPKFSQSINQSIVGMSHNHNFLGLVIQWYAHIRWRKPATENRIIVFFFLKDWLRACVHVMLFPQVLPNEERAHEAACRAACFVRPRWLDCAAAPGASSWKGLIFSERWGSSKSLF